MTFATLLSEADAQQALPSAGDVLAVGLPLLRQLAQLHAGGMVTRMGGLDHITYIDGELGFDPEIVQRPSSPNRMVDLTNSPNSRAALEIAGRVAIDLDDGYSHNISTLDVLTESDALPTRPVLVNGYQAWEQRLDHHDQLTDIHLAGLLLTSYATGLDLDLPTDITELASNRRHLLRLNPGLHPVVAGVLSEMIEPNRNRRPPELVSLISRLENHRALAADLNLDDAYRLAAASPGTSWQSAVLSTLRDRVFDLTRRNRAIYFRPTAASVGLTEASVPMMLNVDRIKPADLLTWNDANAKQLTGGVPRNLGKWCRFEESPHVAPSLDKLISADRRSKAEYGFGRLKMIVAFLRWVDPETNETIHSPLVFMPVSLTKKRGVQPIYRLACDTEATVNPDLRHLLNVRFGIELPTTIDSSPDAIKSLVAELEREVRATDPATRIEVIEQPRITLLRQRAKVRLDAYRRRRVTALANSGRWRRVDHSYDDHDWRPLGLTLYKKFVHTPDFPLRSLAGADARPVISSRHDDLSFAATREHQSFAVETSDTNRHRWEVDLCSVTLASVGSKRSSLVRDYDELLQDVGVAHTHVPFVSVFSPEPRTLLPANNVAGVGTDLDLVLPADDAQARAVRRALRGESFIIQGPPGTGKSQTITNLIAALVADGKRVLFVCEKRAAIDVVANRLKQVGLGELTATIHDSQTDRRSFIAERGAVYDRWLEGDASRASGNPIERKAKIRKRMDAEVARLSVLEADLNAGGIAGRDLIERAVTLRLNKVKPAELIPGTVPEAGPSTAPHSVPVADFIKALPFLQEVSEALASSGRSPILGDEFALRIHPAEAASVSAVQAAANEQRAKLYALRSAGVRLEDVTAGELLRLSRDAAMVATIPAAVQYLDGSPPVGLAEAILHQRKNHREVAESRAAIEHWSALLDPAEARTALAIATQQEGAFFNILSARWRAVKKSVRAAYNFDAHQIEPSITDVLTRLVAHHEAVEAREGFLADSLRRWGTSDPAALKEVLTEAADGPLPQFSGELGFDPDAIAIHAQDLAVLNSKLLIWPEGTLAELLEWADGAAVTLPSVQPALERWGALAEFGPELLLTALTPGAPLDTIERAVVDRGVENLRSRLVSVGLSGTVIDGAIERLLSTNQELLEANAQVTVNTVRERFLRNVEFALASKADRTPAEKARMTAYRAGRKILENEFGKKMRHKPIRELASGDPGVVVADLAPIWLMSPLSVSETLPLDTALFDTVVFDEASQIPVEDALPTMFRAPQVIVVGDRMQLPPTTFFTADVEPDADDDELLVDEDGHNLILSLDADSFLTQADLKLPSILLNWHYRSRSESLIAYSNTAFYDSQLATIPDRRLDDPTQEPISVAVPTQGAANVRHVLDRPISFHRMTQSVYAERRNEFEADYIAEMIRALLLGPNELTIGVVAFSQAQQAEIEESLAELATADPQFAGALDREMERSNGEEFVGLFVKNLENVQGDERDIIIMSVCYGPDLTGRIRMNFGPINQQGGERRLNVIFSRAKQHMAIVSSLDGSQITNLHNPGAANLAHFLTYAAAESMGDTPAGKAALARIPGVGSRDSETVQATPVVSEIARALRDEGLTVDEAVGRSAFRIDLAVRGASSYTLGLLLEPAGSKNRGSSSRYLAEAGVLQAFGWPIMRISITDWLDDRSGVVQRVLTAVAD
ncbi:MAG: DUF4011 domain-containing protein [Acidimicrobiales bacterium]|nr:DUF4011 domain-containing protein [Acidimicrobiales bacterium]